LKRLAKEAQKVAAEKREKDKQVSLFQATRMKDWKAEYGNISSFDDSKVNVMLIHEQVPSVCQQSSRNTKKCKCLVTCVCIKCLDKCTCVLLHVYIDHLHFLVLGRQLP
jgi:hypothetical protein